MFDHQATDSSNRLSHWEYRVIPEICSHPDFGTYTSYGIQVCQRQDQHCQFLSILHDISSKRAFVEELAALFTRQQLSPLHLKDAVEDLLP